MSKRKRICPADFINPHHVRVARAKRLILLETKWDMAGGGSKGRNKGKNRAGKKSKAHSNRLQRLWQIILHYGTAQDKQAIELKLAEKPKW